MSSDDYTTYDCSEHGIFQKRNDVDDGKCAYISCSGQITKVENIKELRLKYRTELGFDINK